MRNRLALLSCLGGFGAAYQVFTRKDDASVDAANLLVIPLDLRPHLPCGLLMPPTNLQAENYVAGYSEDGRLAVMNPIVCPEYDQVIHDKNRLRSHDLKLPYYDEIVEKLTNHVEGPNIDMPGMVVIKAECLEGRWKWTPPKLTCSTENYMDASIYGPTTTVAVTTTEPTEFPHIHNEFDLAQYSFWVGGIFGGIINVQLGPQKTLAQPLHICASSVRLRST